MTQKAAEASVDHKRFTVDRALAIDAKTRIGCVKATLEPVTYETVSVDRT